MALARTSGPGPLETFATRGAWQVVVSAARDPAQRS